jgi:hypothetical protein
LTRLLSGADLEGYYKCDKEQSYINFKETRPFVDALNLQWCEDSMLFSSEILGIIIDNKFAWRPHVDYVVAKVKAVTKALYPLLCGKSKLFLRKQTAIVFVLPPTINDVRIHCLDLRLHLDSVGTSSATEQIAACSDKGAVVFAK